MSGGSTMSVVMATNREDDRLVPLGDGPVATVLAGVHAESGEAFALKVYPGRVDRRTQAEVTEELGRLAALRAHAPVLVADRVEETPDGRCALRMELCSQSLPELIGAFGPLSIPDALALGQVLAAALAVAHREGIVHGGVAPGNVLFRPSGEAVLADFGLTLRQVFPPDPLVSVDHLAPETIRDGTLDERSDLYGLGAILYLSLIGHSPHRGRPGERPDERLLRVLSTPPPTVDRPGLPPGLDQLVAALLARKPDARPLDAATVTMRLGAMLGPVAPGPDGEVTQRVAVPPPAELTQPVVKPAPVPAPPSAGFDDFTEERTGPVGRRAKPIFDDFSALPAWSGPPPPQGFPGRGPGAPGPGPRPAVGAPILVFGPKTKRRRPSRTALMLAASGAVVVLLATAVLLLLNPPSELAVPPVPAEIGRSTVAPPPSTAVRVDFDAPVDRGDYVELSWRSNVALTFAVVVAGEGQQNQILLTNASTTYRVPVDPARRYCFLIQGTDGQNVFQSQEQPIRGATCKN